jgi:hypothetical protein
MLGATKRKQPWLRGKLEDKDSKAPGGRKSAFKGCSRDPLGYTFVNVSAMDFDPSLAEIFEMAVVLSSSLLRRSSPDDSFWDKRDDCYSIDASLSSLLDNNLETVPQTREDDNSP